MARYVSRIPVNASRQRHGADAVPIVGNAPKRVVSPMN